MKKLCLLILNIFLLYVCQAEQYPGHKRDFVVTSDNIIIYEQEYSTPFIIENLQSSKIHFVDGSNNQLYTIDSAESFEELAINNNANKLLYIKSGNAPFGKDSIVIYDIGKKQKIKTIKFTSPWPIHICWDETTNNFYADTEDGILEFNENGTGRRYAVKNETHDNHTYILDAGKNQILYYKEIFEKKSFYSFYTEIFIKNVETNQSQFLCRQEKEDVLWEACFSDDYILWVTSKKYDSNKKDNAFILHSYNRKTGETSVVHKTEKRIENLQSAKENIFFEEEESFDHSIFCLNLLTNDKKIIYQVQDVYELYWYSNGHNVWVLKDEDGNQYFDKIELN